MNYGFLIFIFIVIFFNLQPTLGAENEYGIAKAWFNGENATVNGVKLKMDQPFEVKVKVFLKIDGDVSLKLYEPGVTRAYKIINGPSDIEKWIDNLNLESGWSRTYTWTVAPNGAWKNGNAPINVFVQFNKGMINKQIDFTIANPYILDEQYTGAASAPKLTSTSTGTLQSTPVKETPFLSAIITVSALILAWRWRRGTS
jgi:sarcinarray family protein